MSSKYLMIELKSARHGACHQTACGTCSMNAYSGETLMQFPVAIEWGDENTATGIIFPDIPGAITAADTLEQAYAQAVEVVHLQLTELAKAGQQIPRPGKVAELRKRPEYDGYGWGFVEVDVTPYLGRTEKINVTLPGIVIRKIDAYVALHGIKSRSAFLASVATEKLEGL